jgi:hypothetical protein
MFTARILARFARTRFGDRHAFVPNQISTAKLRNGYFREYANFGAGLFSAVCMLLSDGNLQSQDHGDLINRASR